MFTRHFCSSTSLAIALLLSVLWPASAAADENKKLIWQGDLGLAAQVSTGLIENLNERDGELSASVLVSGGLYYGDFFVEATPFGQNPFTLGYTLSSNKHGQFSLVGQSWFQEISQEEQDEGNLLDGLLVRQSSFEVGVEYLTQIEEGDFRVRALTDALGRHEGHLFIADYTRAFFTRSLLILPSVGVTYMSEEAVDYYYGIEQREATATRPVYRPGSGWTVTARLYVERPLAKHWTLFGFASYSHFNDSITDSPIVTVNDGTYNLAIGVLWSF